MGGLGKVPFSLYDFLAYLSTGFLLIYCLDHARPQPILAELSLNSPSALALLILSYTTGHILAMFAHAVLESHVMRRGLGKSEELLMRPPLDNLRSKLLPLFFTPLPEDTRQAILKKAKAQGVTSNGRSLYYHCLHTVKSDEATSTRLAISTTQIGFCRNMSFTLFLVALILAADSWTLSWWNLALVAFSLIGALGMYLRFLIFYRLYTLEVFTAYAAHCDSQS